ncbi:MAG: hypothetical protein WD534_05385 [Phycisphaeraceae bacterium]
MDHGDEVAFTFTNGETRRITLLETDARVTYTTLDTPKVQQGGAVTNYEFTATLEIDGRQHTLWREVATQRSFYEPWLIDGMAIYLDAVSDIFDFLTEQHGDCRPRKAARLAIHEADQSICPDLLHPWCPLPPGGLNITDCYNGEDCWLGAYFGAAAHGGLDINHPAGVPIFAPFDIDDHEMFNTTYAGQNNNRWRGQHTWPDGSTWVIQVHHLIGLTDCREHQPIPAGRQMARGAGVGVGSHEHSHFVFAVIEPGQMFEDRVLLDPWILFRQMYIDQHGRKGAGHARQETVPSFTPSKVAR